jgi:uncharacterized protein with PIN domain
LNKSSETEIKLLADAMLGRLAKWLRLLGYNTAYLADTDDFAVMRLARAEGRLILTRDRGLARRRGVRALLVESEKLEDQLRQVGVNVGPPSNPPFSRCPVCNQPLVEAAPELVADRVPPYVRRTHTSFSLCVACDRLYWPGTHWQQMRVLVEGLRDEEGFDTIELKIWGSEIQDS